MLFRKVLLFCFFSLVISAPASNDEDTPVDELLARLTCNNTSGVSGVLLLLPTFGTNIMSYLRSALQQENENLSNFDTSTPAPSTLKFYPQSNLNLVNLGGKNYFFSKHQTLSWIDAVSFCRLFNMDLVSVETREEDQLIINHLESIGLAGKTVVYTSGTKAGSATYQWINGNPLIYNNWFPGQPANPATEHCLVYWDKAWHDYHCSGYPSPFICEDS